MTSRGGPASPVGYAEVPDFHVEVVRRDDPDLRDRSILVGGDPAKRGKVVAASADLRAQGITEGMGMAEALSRAPRARWVRTDIHHAREVSGLLRAAIRREVDAVEVEGLAGFYMPVPRDPEAAVALAARLEARVAERTALPLRMGIAPVRFAARLAAEDAGASGLHRIAPDAFEAYLLAQPLERLPGVGPKTAARLAELGVTDVPRLRALGLERLEVLLGNHGRSLWMLACGEDPKPLRTRRHPSTLSREETLDGSDVQEVEAALGRLSASLEAALRRDGLRARRLALRLVDLDARVVTRSAALEGGADQAAALANAARRLLARTDPETGSVRRVALILKGLEVSGATDRQLDLF